jgi:hypothetical protein
MLYLVFKTALSAVIIVAVGELARRSPLSAGLLASLPLVSVLAIIWLYVDTGSTTQVTDLCRSIFLLILPSLIFFVALPLSLKIGTGFPAAVAIAIAVTTATYTAYVALLDRFGITF